MTNDTLIAYLAIQGPMARHALTAAVVRDVVLTTAADVFGVALAELVSKLRRRDVSAARRVTCHVLRRDYHLSFKAIGRALNVDHTSAISALRRECDPHALGLVSARVRAAMERDYGRETVDRFVTLRRAEMMMTAAGLRHIAPPQPPPKPNARLPRHRCTCGHAAVDHFSRGRGNCSGYDEEREAVVTCQCKQYTPKETT